MKLKPTYPSLDDVPSELKEYYTARPDGMAVLDLDGLPPNAVSKSRLDEFRTNNVELLRQKEELEQKLAADAEKLAEMEELRAQLQKQGDKDKIDAGKIDEVVEERIKRRIAEMTREHENQLKAAITAKKELETKYGETESRLYDLMVSQSVMEAVNEVGSPRAGAVGDIQSRARQVWKMRDGKLVPMDQEGQIIYGPDGETPLSPKQWTEGLVEKAPHLFEDTSGGGGQGSGDSGQRRAHQGGGQKRIPASDMEAFGANLEGIAAGTVQVVADR